MPRLEICQQAASPNGSCRRPRCDRRATGRRHLRIIAAGRPHRDRASPGRLHHRMIAAGRLRWDWRADSRLRSFFPLASQMCWHMGAACCGRPYSENVRRWRVERRAVLQSDGRYWFRWTPWTCVAIGPGKLAQLYLRAPWARPRFPMFRASPRHPEPTGQSK